MAFAGIVPCNGEVLLLRPGPRRPPWADPSVPASSGRPLRVSPPSPTPRSWRVCVARANAACVPTQPPILPFRAHSSSLCLFCRGFRASAPLPDLLSRHRPVALRLAEGVPFARHHVFRSREPHRPTKPPCPTKPAPSALTCACLRRSFPYCPAAHSAASLLYSVHRLHHPSSSSCSSTS